MLFRKRKNQNEPAYFWILLVLAAFFLYGLYKIFFEVTEDATTTLIEENLDNSEIDIAQPADINYSETKDEISKLEAQIKEEVSPYEDTVIISEGKITEEPVSTVTAEKTVSTVTVEEEISGEITGETTFRKITLFNKEVEINIEETPAELKGTSNSKQYKKIGRSASEERGIYVPEITKTKILSDEEILSDLDEIFDSKTLTSEQAFEIKMDIIYGKIELNDPIRSKRLDIIRKFYKKGIVYESSDATITISGDTITVSTAGEGSIYTYTYTGSVIDVNTGIEYGEYKIALTRRVKIKNRPKILNKKKTIETAQTGEIVTTDKKIRFGERIKVRQDIYTIIS